MSVYSREALLVLVPGNAGEALRAAAKSAGWTLLELGSVPVASWLAHSETRFLLWLHPWTELDAPLRGAIESALRDRVGSGVAGMARIEMACERTSLALGRQLVLAGPGAWRLTIDGPVPAESAQQIELAPTWRLRAPASISDHLGEMNQQTTAMAALARELGERPSYGGVALTPIWRVARAWLGARGSRQHALTRAILEGYRSAVAVAKLWESERVTGEPPP